MTTYDLLDWAKEHGACQGYLEWLSSLPDRTPAAVYAACPRGDWLLWWHSAVGTPVDAMMPIARRAVERAEAYAAYADSSAVMDMPHARARERTHAHKAAYHARKIVDSCTCNTDAHALMEAVADAETAAYWAAKASLGNHYCDDAIISEHMLCADDVRSTLPVPETDVMR